MWIQSPFLLTLRVHFIMLALLLSIPMEVVASGIGRHRPSYLSYISSSSFCIRRHRRRPFHKISTTSTPTVTVTATTTSATSPTTFTSSTRRAKGTSSRGPYHRTAPTMMPEGPEVRTLVDQLQPAVGKRLVDMQFVSGRYTKHGTPKGFDNFSRTMTNYRRHEDENVDVDVDVVQDWNCKGKFIWLTLDQGRRGARSTSASSSGEGTGTGQDTSNNSRTMINDATKNDSELFKSDANADADADFHRTIWITLGMTGRFVKDAFSQAQEDDGSTHNQPRWYFEFLDDYDNHKEEHNRQRKRKRDQNKLTRKIYYYDTRNFGTLRFSTSKKELEDKLNSLGPDILGNPPCTQEEFMTSFRKPRQVMNVCRFLMDQSKLAGVGNYILAESLYRSNLDPFASLDEISDKQAKILYREIMDVSRLSYESQGMTRARGGSYRDINGNQGKFTFSLQCYGRDKCPRGKEVIRETNGPHGRTIWYVEDQLFMTRAEREVLSGNGKMITGRERVTPRAAAGTTRMTNNDTKNRVENPIGDNDVNKSSQDGSNASDNTDLALGDSLKEDGWRETLSHFLASEKFARLSDFVSSERRHHTVYPPHHQVFSALNMCPLKKVKVVIIGQDPYHGPNQGHGLAFSVQRGVNPPPSLKNIFKELVEDEGIPYPAHGNLECWAKQGVLLLNTVLTVQHGKANSHPKMGWEDMTDEIVEVLNREKEGLVFLLWGRPAAQKGKGVDPTRHTVITTSHPSPLGATKTNSPFLGSKCFSRCNEALASKGLQPIDWSVN